MSVTLCPECDNYIKLSNKIQEGQIITCNRCRTALEVVDIDPVELDIHEANNRRQHDKMPRFRVADDWDEEYAAPRRKPNKRRRVKELY